LIKINNGRIANDSELEALKTNDGLDFPLPEMVFFSNYLSCIHQNSGIEVNFNPVDALKGCKIKRNETGEPDRELFKVKMHHKWQNRTDAHGMEIKQWRDDFDWTYTTTYAATIKDTSGACVKRRTSTKRIDYEMLKRKDPILWFGTTQLYEDDLFDNGDSSYTIKVRVMADCFFILGRMWLRVDDTYLRIFDTRIFHAFGQNDILIETCHQEASKEKLHQIGKDFLLTDHRNCKRPEQVDKKLPSIHAETQLVIV